MTHNDVLRAIRYMLDLSDGRLIEIIHLVDPALPVDIADIQAMLKKEDDPELTPCSDRVLAHLLDGLVIYYRGVDERLPVRPVERRINNNIVLKKLRVAFALKDVDMHEVFALAGYPIGKPELSALFRQADHRHYRACGDQILRNFLKGLTVRFRG